MRVCKQTITAVLLACCLALVGCGEQSKDTTGGDAKGKGKAGRTIGITFMSLSNPFFQACKRSAGAVIEAHGDEMMIVNAENKSSVQLSGVENLIQAGVACILLNPVNSDAAASTVAQANAAKIPVVTFDVTVSKGKVESFVESNNYLAGQFCADYIGTRLKGKGRIVVIDHPEVTSVKQRTAGFHDHLAKHFPNIEIVDTQLGKGRKEVALAVTENLLRAHTDIDAIFAINDPSALGAAQAVKAAKNTRIFIVGIDGAPDAIAELKKADSPFAMSVAQFPQEIGRVAAEMAYKVLAGETPPEHVSVVVMPVTRDNLDIYPGWEGEMPKAFDIPWKSHIKLGAKPE